MNRIKGILKQQGRSQTWLAEQIIKSYNVVTNYCYNHSQPSIPMLNSISEILDIDIKELLVSNKKVN